MSLFRRHNKKPFEQQLEQQLGDMEYKPSESLWERINSGIPSDGFEASVHSKLDSFEHIPYPETWHNIESRLPAEKASVRRFALFGIAFSVLLAVIATAYLGTSNTTENQTAVLDDVSPKSKPSLSIPNPEEQQIDIVTRQDQKSPDISIVQPSSSAPTINRNQSAANAPQTQPLANIDVAQPVIKTAATHKIASPHHPQNKSSLPQPAVLALATQQPSPIVPVSENPPRVQEQTPTLVADTPTTSTDLPPQKTDTSIAIAGREITNGLLAAPDSQAVVSTASSNTYKSQDEFTRFSISVFGGASLSGTTYSSPTNSALNFDENIKLRKELERPTVDWSGGFMLDYRLNDRWMVSAGIMMVNFNQQLHYDIDSAVSPANSADVGAPVVNPNDSFLVGNTYSNRIRYTWTEIPLLINYTLHSGQRWDVDLQGGVGYAFISTIDGGMVSYDNKGVLVLKDKESFPQISNTVFVTFQPQISRKFAQGVSVGIVPSFKYSVTSIIGNENWIQQHPYFIGLSACLRKQF
jgi:hypothetical protein